MRPLSDYVLKTRTDEVPVSAPLGADRGQSPPATSKRPARITMGFAAHDADTVRRLAGQDAVLVRNIQRPGEALARLRLVAVDPRTSRLVAEVLSMGEVRSAGSPEHGVPAAHQRTAPARTRGARKGLVASGAVLGLLVLGLIAWAGQTRSDRKCTSSGDCPDGFACAPWGSPSPGEAEYRSCERACQSDGDCPGAEQCFLVDDGPGETRVCRSSR